MERFVIIAALAVAGFIAVGSMVGEVGPIRIDLSETSPGVETTPPVIAPSAAALESTQATVYAATSLRVRDAALTLIIIPEERADIAVSVVGAEGFSPLKARLNGDELVLEGDLGGKIRQCAAGPDGYVVTVAGRGERKAAELPRALVRMPLDVEVRLEEGAAAQIGPARSAEIDVVGCGDTSIGDVQNTLNITAAGAGDIRAGAANNVEVDIAGSGDVTVGVIAGDMDVTIAGSGSLAAASVGGDLDIAVAGSGDVKIANATADKADVSIAGSGNVSIGGLVRRLDTSVMGSGEISVDRVVEESEQSVMGSGEVRIGARGAPPEPPAPPAPPVPAPAPTGPAPPPSP